MANLLTDRAFWVNYWESKKGLAVQLPENYLFHKQLADVIKKENVKNTFEDRLNDKDPQLEKAVAEILKDLK